MTGAPINRRSFFGLAALAPVAAVVAAKEVAADLFSSGSVGQAKWGSAFLSMKTSPGDFAFRPIAVGSLRTRRFQVEEICDVFSVSAELESSSFDERRTIGTIVPTQYNLSVLSPSGTENVAVASDSTPNPQGVAATLTSDPAFTGVAPVTSAALDPSQPVSLAGSGVAGFLNSVVAETLAAPQPSVGVSSRDLSAASSGVAGLSAAIDALLADWRQTGIDINAMTFRICALNEIDAFMCSMKPDATQAVIPIQTTNNIATGENYAD